MRHALDSFLLLHVNESSLLRKYLVMNPVGGAVNSVIVPAKKKGALDPPNDDDFLRLPLVAPPLLAPSLLARLSMNSIPSVAKVSPEQERAKRDP